MLNRYFFWNPCFNPVVIPSIYGDALVYESQIKEILGCLAGIQNRLYALEEQTEQGFTKVEADVEKLETTTEENTAAIEQLNEDIKTVPTKTYVDNEIARLDNELGGDIADTEAKIRSDIATEMKLSPTGNFTGTIGWLNYTTFAQRYYYVNSITGSDDNIGTVDKPMKTIAGVLSKTNICVNIEIQTPLTEEISIPISFSKLRFTTSVGSEVNLTIQALDRIFLFISNTAETNVNVTFNGNITESVVRFTRCNISLKEINNSTLTINSSNVEISSGTIRTSNIDFFNSHINHSGTTGLIVCNILFGTTTITGTGIITYNISKLYFSSCNIDEQILIYGHVGVVTSNTNISVLKQTNNTYVEPSISTRQNLELELADKTDGD